MKREFIMLTQTNGKAVYFNVSNIAFIRKIDSGEGTAIYLNFTLKDENIANITVKETLEQIIKMLNEDKVQ